MKSEDIDEIYDEIQEVYNAYFNDVFMSALLGMEIKSVPYINKVETPKTEM